MKKARINYFSACFVTLILGILSRHFTQIPLFVGDVLYAVVAYFGFRFLIPNNGYSKSFFWPLLWCFGVEFLQLYRAPWMLSIRETTLGHYILGQGFLWNDLLCYILGATLALFMDYLFLNLKIQNS